MAIRVLLVDDHPVVRNGIRDLLSSTDDIVVVGEASTGEEAVRLVQELTPDILLLDMELPGMKGVDVARQLRAGVSTVRVLALSAYDDEAYTMALLASGAAGYLTKDEALDMVVDAVRGVARGEMGWLSRRISAHLMKQMTREHAEPSQVIRLSTREEHVLQMVAQGYDNPHIAASLGIAEGTVKNHVTNIYAKLGVRTRAEAVAWAWRDWKR